MRKYILQHYVSLDHNTLIIGHHGISHMQNFLKTWIGLVSIWILYIGIWTWISTDPIVWYVAWSIVAIVYIYFVINFLNIYLDCIIITSTWLVIFEREKILEYKSETLNRTSIDNISHSQQWLRERLLGTWSLHIWLNQWASITLEHIPNIQRTANLLWTYKHQIDAQHNHSLYPWPEEDTTKFDLLVETLWEIIKEYTQKPKLPDF